MNSSARAVLLTLLAAGSLPAAAADFQTQVWVNPGIYSYHFDRDQNYRENNWGFGVEARVAPEHSAMAGSFINSDRERTRYVAWHWRPWTWDVGGAKVSAGLIGGVFDGYPKYKSGKWFPAAMPVLSIEGERVGVNLSVIPDIPDRLSGAVALQFKLKVW